MKVYSLYSYTQVLFVHMCVYVCHLTRKVFIHRKLLNCLTRLANLVRFCQHINNWNQVSQISRPLEQIAVIWLFIINMLKKRIMLCQPADRGNNATRPNSVTYMYMHIKLEKQNINRVWLFQILMYLLWMTNIYCDTLCLWRYLTTW